MLLSPPHLRCTYKIAGRDSPSLVFASQSRRYQLARGPKMLAGARGYRPDASAAVSSLHSQRVASQPQPPDPSGAGVQRAVKFALRDAELTTADIVHLNAHATSTPAGDVAEANALRAALGKDADHVAVSATKSMTGHLLGGAGAIESVFIVKTLQDRMAPPTINIENLDPAVTVDVVRDKPRALPAGDIAALNDSFGFGGHNVVLVFKSI